MSPEGVPQPNRKLELNERYDLSVLMAEDDQIIRTMVGLSLRNRYSRVKTVENGESLFAQLTTSGESYDIVITDINMGDGIDGVELLQKIHATNEFANLPIIVLTGGNRDKQDEIELLGGVYIEKPFKEEELYTAIEELTKHEVIIKVPTTE